MILALALRVINLSNTPSGFHADEASFYINSLAIAETGADEDGNKFPISLSSYIDPKPALYSYFQAPFTVFIADKIFAARLPAVLLSLASLIFSYLFVKELVEQKIALISTLVLAISPWHIVVSRGTHEVIASFLFLLIALYSLIKLQKNLKKNDLLHFGTFFLSSFLSMYFYHSAKVLLPLLVLTLLTYYYKKSKKFINKSLLILVILIATGIGSIVIQESGSRFSAVSIFTDSATQDHLVQQIYGLHNQLPTNITRIFYNKGQAYLMGIASEYFAYLSPDFLFLNGGKPTRYIVPSHGMLYLLEAPILIFGLYLAVRKKDKQSLIFFSLIFLSPLASSITTQETPSIIRSFPMILGFSYFIALGIKSISEIEKRLVRIPMLVILAFAYFWQIGYFNIQYHIQAYYHEPFYRNSPYTEIAKEVAVIEKAYSEIQVTNDLRPLYAYFVMEDLISIRELQAKPHSRDNHEYNLGKYTFNRGVCEFDEFKEGVLYIAETSCRESRNEFSSLEPVKSISYQDGTEVYELLQLSQ